MRKKIQKTSQNYFTIDLASFFSELYRIDLEYSFFILKAGTSTNNTKEYSCENNISIKIQAGSLGFVSIHDKDLWTYAITKLLAKSDPDELEGDRTIQFVAHDYLVATNRRTDGDNYKRMLSSLQRLADTVIVVSKKTKDGGSDTVFRLLDSWRVITREADDRMVALEVDFPSWVIDALQDKEVVLSVHPDYFSLRKPLERRIYELAKKYCKNQIRWSTGLDTLFAQSGSISTIREFRRLVGVMSRANKLPEYQLRYLKSSDVLTFYSRGTRGYKAQIRDMVSQLNKQRNI